MTPLGLGTTISSIDSGQIYKELSELDNSADLDVHFDFSTLAGDHGDEIAAATNLGAAGSGKNINSNEGTPTLDRTTLSRASVNFDGSDEVLDMAADYTTTGKAMTFFMVFYRGDTSNDYVVTNADDGATDYLRITGSGGNIVTKMNNESAVTTAIDSTAGSTIDYTVAASVPTALVIRRNSDGEIFIYADNNLFIGTKTNTAAKAAATFTVGAFGGTTSGSLADLTGNICEVGIYDVDLGTSKIAILLESLCTKWGIERRS